MVDESREFEERISAEEERRLLNKAPRAFLSVKNFAGAARSLSGI